jgi:hypothetical protein
MKQLHTLVSTSLKNFKLTFPILLMMIGAGLGYAIMALALPELQTKAAAEGATPSAILVVDAAGNFMVRMACLFVISAAAFFAGTKTVLASLVCGIFSVIAMALGWTGQAILFAAMTILCFGVSWFSLLEQDRQQPVQTR